MIYLLFFCSGVSGLIYQVIWVRAFGNVFGNTVYSASMVAALFMLGLGAGSYLAGLWADRRYLTRPSILVRDYGVTEMAIALLGLVISLVIPHLGAISAMASSYVPSAEGWAQLSTGSHAARAVMAMVLLAPITMLMGGTLTLLIRHHVHADFAVGTWRIALLYFVNTAGAAAGAFLTDLLLVPSVGLFGTQLIAVAFNVIAAGGAFVLASGGAQHAAADRGALDEPEVAGDAWPPAVLLAAAALALSGFAAMGMEIVWVRHFTLLLSALRAVYSLLLGVVLVGIAVGALAGGVLSRRTSRPAEWMIVAQGAFVFLTLLGLASVGTSLVTDTAAAVRRVFDVQDVARRTAAELWFNLRPLVLEVAAPALVMGLAFPLANGVVQHAERAVGRRAGLLYLANTIGAVAGALTAGFLLLPFAGLQSSVTVLTSVSLLAVVPLAMLLRIDRRPRAMAAPAWIRVLAVSAPVIAGGIALLLWVRLPNEFLLDRSMYRPGLGENTLTLHEGVNEIVAVSEGLNKDHYRFLITDGHSMSATDPVSQRYMRASAHIPLLLMEHPTNVLVIGFGVGNTTHAATLHPTVERVEVADLSKDVLRAATFFSDWNRNVLTDPRVKPFINDGRQHLQMRRPQFYDLITLEPPPITQAGVGSLYSEDFYALARTRLKPKGYLTQWLPAYQVPSPTALSLVRAFIDVFPQSVLLSGSGAELLLVGVNDSTIELDPARVAAGLAAAPAVSADLRAVDLGTVREIAGMFVGSPSTLAAATRDVEPVTDNRPLQEYSVRSSLNFRRTVLPGDTADFTQLRSWCPRCFAGAVPAPIAVGVDRYIALVARTWSRIPGETADITDPQTAGVVAGSRYLQRLLRDAAASRNNAGLASAAQGHWEEAVAAFQEASKLDPAVPGLQQNLVSARARLAPPR
jgi:spermidine synthase